MVSQARFERVCEELLFRHASEVQQLISMIREMHDTLTWLVDEFREDLTEDEEYASYETIGAARFFLQRRSEMLDIVPDKVRERVLDRLSKEMNSDIKRAIKIVEKTGTLPNYFGAWEAIGPFDEPSDEIYPDYPDYSTQQPDPGYDDDPYDQDQEE